MSEKIIELLHDNPLKFKQNEEEYKTIQKTLFLKLKEFFGFLKVFYE